MRLVRALSAQLELKSALYLSTGPFTIFHSISLCYSAQLCQRYLPAGLSV